MEQQKPTASSPEPPAPRRVVGRPWVKGQSGNPSGRPVRAVERLRRIAGRYTTRMVRALVSIAEDTEQPTEERRKAAMDVLSYYAGKPAVVQEVSGRNGAPVGPLVNVVNVGGPMTPDQAMRMMTAGVIEADPSHFRPALQAPPGVKPTETLDAHTEIPMETHAS